MPLIARKKPEARRPGLPFGLAGEHNPAGQPLFGERRPARQPLPEERRPGLGPGAEAEAQARARRLGVVDLLKAEVGYRAGKELARVASDAIEARKYEKFLKRLEFFAEDRFALTEEVGLIAQIGFHTGLQPKELAGILNVESKRNYLLKLAASVEQNPRSAGEIQRILKTEKKMLRGRR